MTGNWCCARCPERYPNFPALRDHWEAAHNVAVKIVSVIR